MVIPNREGKCCDAVIRQLERAVGTARTAVCDPEVTREGPPVDLRVTLGDQEYALEHTRILPFDDRIEAAKPYQDNSACLEEWFPEPLPGDAFYELYLPLRAPRPGRDRRGEHRLRGLRDWIRSAVEVLQTRAPRRRKLPPHWYEFDDFTGRPDGWDCEFTLARSSDGVLPPRQAGSLALFVGSPEEEEGPFLEDLRRAFEKKCPKLASCKAIAPDIRTVLILEAIDLPFHYDRYMADQVAGLLAGCDVAPDHVFLVYPRDVFWQVWVVKIDDVCWPDERLPMPHKGYQDPPRLVPEEAYPKRLVAEFKRGVGRETPARWRPLFVGESDREDSKQRSGARRESVKGRPEGQGMCGVPGGRVASTRDSGAGD